MVTDTFWPRINGISASISTLTRALRTLGHEVYIAAPDYQSLPTRRRFIDGDRSSPENVIRFPSHAVLFFPEDTMVRFMSPEYIRQQNRVRGLQFDIIHTHTPLVLGILAMYWHPLNRVPLIHTYHTLFEDFMPHYFPLVYLPPRVARPFAHWLSMNVFHWYCNNFDRVIAPSHQVADILCNYYLRCPVSVVPTGIEIERFQNGDGQRIRDEWQIAPQEKLLLFTGRVCHEKNVELLVRALVHILKGEPLARLAIVGQGPAETALKRLAAKLGIASRVHFAGYRPYNEMANIYAAGDLFLFASQTETQGLVTVEAMASGIPVVAVRGPGTLDVLKEETGGLLCEPNEVDLAEQVIRLLRDPTLYAQKAEEARQRSDDFSSLAMARRMLRVYESVL
jgi:glycosyltransferase involved in cell wall biosynthesis